MSNYFPKVIEKSVVNNLFAKIIESVLWEQMYAFCQKDWLHLSREQSEVPVAVKLQELTDAQPDLLIIIIVSLFS